MDAIRTRQAIRALPDSPARAAALEHLDDFTRRAGLALDEARRAHLERTIEAAAVAWYGMTYAHSDAHARWIVVAPEAKARARARVVRLVSGDTVADEADTVALDVFWAAGGG